MATRNNNIYDTAVTTLQIPLQQPKLHELPLLLLRRSSIEDQQNLRYLETTGANVRKFMVLELKEGKDTKTILSFGKYQEENSHAKIFTNTIKELDDKGFNLNVSQKGGGFIAANYDSKSINLVNGSAFGNADLQQVSDLLVKELPEEFLGFRIYVNCKELGKILRK
jgi:hypothetical protein